MIKWYVVNVLVVYILRCYVSREKVMFDFVWEMGREGIIKIVSCI